MANRPTPRQMECLVEFLEQNPGITQGLLLRTHQAKIETKRKWQKFANTANAMGGLVKDGPAWSKYWAEKKCALKKLCQQRAQFMRHNGAETDVMPQLTPLEQRLVAMMGCQSFATRGSGPAVDSFPHNSSSMTQPSTSQAAEDVLDLVFGPNINEQVRTPLHDLEPSQVESNDQVQIANRCGTPRGLEQRDGLHVRFLDTEVRRFEDIESRRVEAEMRTAQALTDIANSVSEMIRLLSAIVDTDRRMTDSSN